MKSFLFAVGLLLACGYAEAGSPPDIFYNDFEFADMRFCTRQSDGLCINQVGQNGNITLPAGEQAAPPTNGGVGHGTLGSGVLSGMTENIQSVSFVNDPTNCHSGSWCMRVDLGAGVPGGAEYTMNTGYWRNAGGGQSAQGCSGFTPPAGCFTNNYFFHWWQKWAPNFGMTPLNSFGCQGKLLYVQSDPGGHSGPGGTQPPQNYYGILVFRFDTGNPQLAHLTWQVNEGNQGQTTLNFTTGVWHEFEVQVDIGNNHTNVWVDGVQFVNAATAFVQGYGVDINRWGMYINKNFQADGVTPADQCVVSQATTFWVDDIGVGTQRIGGTGSSITPPGTPANLTVN